MNADLGVCYCISPFSLLSVKWAWVLIEMGRIRIKSVYAFESGPRRM